MADRPPPQKPPPSKQIVKATTAATFGGSLLVLSGLMLAGTVIGLTIATPLLVIFSPVLVPAGITVFLIVAGFLTAAGLVVAAVSVLTWMYRYLTGKRPPGANKLEHWREGMARKAKEMTELYGAESVQTS